MMKIGCGTSAPRLARAAAARCWRRDEEVLEAREERLDGRGPDSAVRPPSAASFALALDEILPGLVVSAEAIEQASALELAVAIERGRRVEDCERFRVAAGARQ